MPADDARPVLPSRTIGPLASDDPESEPPLRKGEGPGHRPTGQATLASHAARRPLLDGPRTGCRDDLVCRLLLEKKKNNGVCGWDGGHTRDGATRCVGECVDGTVCATS